jgi:hypothetical protein
VGATEVSEANWSADFQRLVLAAAVKGDLLETLPLDAELFASANERGPQPPRQRIATAVAAYFAEYRARPPAAVYWQLVADAGQRLSPEERGELTRESEAVAETEVPADQEYLRAKVREQAQLRAFERAVIQAADVVAAGPSALPRAFEIMQRGMEPIGVAEDKRVSYLAEAEARMEAWRRGDQMGERIATGFPALDEVLRGGPTKREVHYFLAPPKGGKTAALLTVAGAALRRRRGVYLATFEMQAMRMALRMDRHVSRRRAEELTDDLAALERAVAGLRASGASELYIDEFPPQMPNSVAEAARRIERIRRRGGVVDLAIFDYLNIMGSAKDEDEKRHELPRISREISALAKAEDLLIWSAALVNKLAVNKAVIRKTDIAEAFEVIAVLDGATAICGTKAMVRARLRRFYEAAAREEEDEVRAGDYEVDFARMLITPAGEGVVDALSDTVE